MKVECYECGRARKGLETLCSKCGSPFRIYPDFGYRSILKENFPYMHREISLGECITPLLRKDQTAFKLDYFQPTYSYKDRGSKTLISFLADRRNEIGQVLSEDSSGNAGASITAYGSAAGFKVNVFVPETATGPKLDLIRAYGANVTTVSGSREDVRNAAMHDGSFYVGHSVFPEFRDGIRTLAYELFNQYNAKLPSTIYIPTSAGTLLIGVYEGFRHLLESGEIKRIPDLVACQPDLMSPIKAALSGEVYKPSGKKSLADALVTERSPLLQPLLRILREHGSTITVSEEEIIDARTRLAHSGIFTEYSSAVAYAASLKHNVEGEKTVILTGNGLKNAF
ncbi:MAG: pyridoxal-phosphate dependent enzyme [Thermoplasmata archaeon]